MQKRVNRLNEEELLQIIYECLMWGYRIGGIKYKDIIKSDDYQAKVSIGTAPADPNIPYLLAHAMGAHWQKAHMGSWEGHEESKAWCENQPKNEDGSVTQSIPVWGIGMSRDTKPNTRLSIKKWVLT
mgnify:CR=1 FL=1